MIGPGTTLILAPSIIIAATVLAGYHAHRPSKAFSRWAARDTLERCIMNYRKRGPRLRGNLQMAVDRARRNGVDSALIAEGEALLRLGQEARHGK